ncbi:MAG: HU family DNA-binding protein [Tabrizicola sp.]|jgi:DNA-binding protein HU-beta|nr:HU family DNA-binding protein [Tabrizicola sp.]
MSAPQASKSDLIKNVAHRLDTTEAAAAKAVEAVLDGIGMWAKEKKLILRGFGTFEVKHKAARTARNVRTGLPVEVAARDVLAFKAAKQKA